MDDAQHFVQDASELYLVAILQRLSEVSDRSLDSSSELKMDAFWTYANHRGLSAEYLTHGEYAQYKRSVDLHAGHFFERLTNQWPGENFSFHNVEVESRNDNRKADFAVQIGTVDRRAVSLKNYLKDASKPQVCSGTFNSFVLNFLFEPRGVGTFVDPSTGALFRGADASGRDVAIRAAGLAAILDSVHELDRLNANMKEKYVYSKEHEFFAGATREHFKRDCEVVGQRGVDLALSILHQVDPERLKQRVLKMTGVDGSEDILFVDPNRCIDSLTDTRFHALSAASVDPDATVSFTRHGKGIRFHVLKGSRELLSVYVPFTLNKNGAWVSENHRGWHDKEQLELLPNQRRPRKSKEFATSINTYVEFGKTGLFAGAH